jgi:ATP-binding cassette subfamily F protein 3
MSTRLRDAGRQHVRILHDVGFGLEAGDRVGLLGPNGAGKSTLVKTLVGELPLLDGERNAHPDLRIGYFAQHTVESLTRGRRRSTTCANRRASADAAVPRFPRQVEFPRRPRVRVDRWFLRRRARAPGAGDDRVRKPNVLLLDEPTNHLDLDMREALAEALSDFDGAIVLVSHDRHLIGLVCETFVRVADGKVEPSTATWTNTRRGCARARAAKSSAASRRRPV